MEPLLISKEILELLTSHQRRLAGYLRTLIANRVDAEEVLQEVNLYICSHAAEFRPGTDFSAWSLRVAHFCVLSWRRQRSRDRLTFDDDLLERLTTTLQAKASQADRRREALDECLKKVSARDHDLLSQLYGVSGMTPQELAKHLGRSSKGIYETLSRIRLSLLECIQRTLAAERR